MTAHRVGQIHSSRRLGVSVDREGPTVVVAIRGGGHGMTLVLHYRGAASLAALLRDAAGDDDAPSADVELRGTLDTATVTENMTKDNFDG